MKFLAKVHAQENDLSTQWEKVISGLEKLRKSAAGDSERQLLADLREACMHLRDGHVTVGVMMAAKYLKRATQEAEKLAKEMD